MGNSHRALLKKEIKQMKKIVCAFNYKYFAPPESVDDEAAMERFEEFRNDVLYKLVDQWKKMQLELSEMDGRLHRPLKT